MRSIILIAVLLSGSLFGQNWYDDDAYRQFLIRFGGSNVLWSVDLDGSTEYASNTTPVNLDLNDTNRVADIGKDSDFEDGDTTNWTGNGNHSIDTTSTTVGTGSYSGMIISTGTGDADSSVNLPAADFTALEHGKKYTWQVDAKANGGDAKPDVTFQIGDSSKTFSAVEQSAFETLVWNFEWDTTGNPTPDIQLYTNQPDTVYIDEVDLSEAYDMTFSVFAKTSGSAGHIAEWNSISGYIDMYVGSGTINTRYNDGNNTFSLNDGLSLNQWNLFTIIVDRTGNFSLYENGVFINSVDCSSAQRSADYNTFYIGSRGSPNYFTDFIGQTKIDRGYIMPVAEILANYNNGTKGKDFNVTGFEVGWWKWRGNDDLWLDDITGVGNDLTGTNLERVSGSDQVKHPGGYK